MKDHVVNQFLKQQTVVSHGTKHIYAATVDLRVKAPPLLFCRSRRAACLREPTSQFSTRRQDAVV